MCRRTLLSAVVAGACLAVSWTASALASTVTVGPSLTGSYQPFVPEEVGTFTNATEEAGANVTSPVTGTIVCWRLIGATGGPFRLRVLTPDGGNTYTGAGTSAPQTPTGLATQSFATNLSDPGWAGNRTRRLRGWRPNRIHDLQWAHTSRGLDRWRTDRRARRLRPSGGRVRLQRSRADERGQSGLRWWWRRWWCGPGRQTLCRTQREGREAKHRKEEAEGSRLPPRQGDGQRPKGKEGTAQGRNGAALAAAK